MGIWQKARSKVIHRKSPVPKSSAPKQAAIAASRVRGKHAGRDALVGSRAGPDLRPQPRRSSFRAFSMPSPDSPPSPMRRHPDLMRATDQPTLNESFNVIIDANRAVSHRACGAQAPCQLQRRRNPLLVVPKRTLARRLSDGEPLTVEETDKAVRLARVDRLAANVFGDVSEGASLAAQAEEGAWRRNAARLTSRRRRRARRRGHAAPDRSRHACGRGRVRIWRISSFDDLSGGGGLGADGRWHDRGRHVVPAGGSPGVGPARGDGASGDRS